MRKLFVALVAASALISTPALANHDNGNQKSQGHAYGHYKNKAKDMGVCLITWKVDNGDYSNNNVASAEYMTLKEAQKEQASSTEPTSIVTYGYDETPEGVDYNFNPRDPENTEETCNALSDEVSG